MARTLGSRWIRLEASSPRDPKMIGIAAELDIDPAHAFGHIVATWCAIGEHAPDGNLASASDLVLETWASWRGARGAFAAAYRATFMTGDRMPGWDKLQGKLIEMAERDRARERRADPERSSGDSPRIVHGESADSPASRDGTERNDTNTPTTLPATRTKRESAGHVRSEEEAVPPTTAVRPRARGVRNEAGAQRVTWLTPIADAWEAINGAGSFPHGQAARELSPLVKAGAAPEEVARRLTWYLTVRGTDGDLTPEQLSRVRFIPNLRSFRLSFAQFDPSAPVQGAGFPTPEPNAVDDPDFILEAERRWAAQVGIVSKATLRDQLRSAASLYGAAAVLAAIDRFGAWRALREPGPQGQLPGLPQFVATIRAHIPPPLLPPEMRGDAHGEAA